MATMEALEFVATAENDSIKVPEEYRYRLQAQFRVLILQEPMNTKKITQACSESTKARILKQIPRRVTDDG